MENNEEYERKLHGSHDQPAMTKLIVSVAMIAAASASLFLIQ